MFHCNDYTEDHEANAAKIDGEGVSKAGFGALTGAFRHAILCPAVDSADVPSWRDGRVDDCDGLENRSGLTLTGGSNPSPSARTIVIYLHWGGARVVEWGRLLSG